MSKREACYALLSRSSQLDSVKTSIIARTNISFKQWEFPISSFQRSSKSCIKSWFAKWLANNSMWVVKRTKTTAKFWGYRQIVHNYLITSRLPKTLKLLTLSTSNKVWLQSSKLKETCTSAHSLCSIKQMLSHSTLCTKTLFFAIMQIQLQVL